jgi:uncharacterized protein (TIGR00299 family) protein
MIGWIDAGAGASGDMLLAALVDAGVSEALVTEAVGRVAPERVGLSTGRVLRGGIEALRAYVEAEPSTTPRGLPDILGLIDGAGLDAAVAQRSRAVFTRLAHVEAAVHGVDVVDVHFHEVGALDAIADVVGVSAAVAALGLDELHCSPVAVGSGTVSTSHGEMSVPPPAVAALLVGVPTYSGPQPTELCTPTGAALLTSIVDHWGAQPAMTVASIGSGAGAKDFATSANVLRVFVGEPVTAPAPRLDDAERQTSGPLVVETNVDDLDPRLWPAVLERLLAAGASDAWLAPILMKKGRPAHTLSVLVERDRLDAVEDVIFTDTSAIGLRTTGVGKVALERETRAVYVSGQRISVKVARRGGVVVNAQPEYDDVRAAAANLSRSPKAVLAEAVAAAAALWTEDPAVDPTPQP